MSISDELKELEALFYKGTLTQDEFQIAKRKVLEGPLVAEPAVHLEMIKAQNELAQIDREWEIERQEYVVVGRHGNQQVPDKTSSACGTILIGCFGTFWTVAAISITSRGDAGPARVFLPLTGFVILVLGVLSGVRRYTTAQKYEEAHDRYKARRKEHLDRQRSS